MDTNARMRRLQRRKEQLESVGTSSASIHPPAPARLAPAQTPNQSRGYIEDNSDYSNNHRHKPSLDGSISTQSMFPTQVANRTSHAMTNAAGQDRTQRNASHQVHSTEAFAREITQNRADVSREKTKKPPVYDDPDLGSLGSLVSSDEENYPRFDNPPPPSGNKANSIGSLVPNALSVSRQSHASSSSSIAATRAKARFRSRSSFSQRSSLSANESGQDTSKLSIAFVASSTKRQHKARRSNSVDPRLSAAAALDVIPTGISRQNNNSPTHHRQGKLSISNVSMSPPRSPTRNYAQVTSSFSQVDMHTATSHSTRHTQKRSQQQQREREQNARQLKKRNVQQPLVHAQQNIHRDNAISATPSQRSNRSQSPYQLDAEEKRRTRLANKTRTFQKPQDMTKLYVATVDSSSRCVFLTPSNLTKQALPHTLLQLEKAAPSNVHASAKLLSISPSFRLCQISHYLSQAYYHGMSSGMTTNMIPYNLSSSFPIFGRQLIWSPSVSPEADPFHGWENGDSDDETESGEYGDSPTASKNDSVDKKRIHFKELTGKIPSTGDSTTKRRRVGRYYALTKREHLKTLPIQAPKLSVNRARLPMRSDVGFPRATDEEITLKMKEQQIEALWEEACPRLAVLISARDVGEFAQQKGGIGGTRRFRDLDHQQNKFSVWQKCRGLDYYVPYPLPLKYFDDFIMAPIPMKRRPDPTSVFAPPLDSVPAGGNRAGWKPRPVADRPPGRHYVLVDPISLTFENVGDLEPLVCSLSLYCLPHPSPGGHDTPKYGCKISEEFVYPAGDWRNSLEHVVTETNIHASAFDVEVDSPTSDVTNIPPDKTPPKKSNGKNWKELRKRALFSYDPLAILTQCSQFLHEAPSTDISSAGQLIQEQLCLVVQVYKVAHKDALAPYITEEMIINSVPPPVSHVSKRADTPFKQFKRKVKGHSSKKPSMLSISQKSSRSLEEHSDACRYRAWNVFENFGTQFLTPLCFGVVPIFDSVSLEGRKVADSLEIDGVDRIYKWPNGCTRNVAMYGYPVKPESSESFIRRLCDIRWGSTNRVDTDIFDIDLSLNHTNISTTPSKNTIRSEASVSKSSIKRLKKKVLKSVNKDVLSMITPSKSTEESLVASLDNSGRLYTSTYTGEIPIRLFATATFVTSFLGADFSKALQPSLFESSMKTTSTSNRTPVSPVPFSLDIKSENDRPKIEEKPSESGRPVKVLVDVMGDSAVASRRSNEQNKSTNPRGNKESKSHFIKLSDTHIPAGYMDSADICEILYLPPAGNKTEDHFGNNLNLLYLYPKSLIVNNHDIAIDQDNYFSIRIQLVQKEESNGKKINENILDAFYNPSPGGKTLIPAIYTKVPTLLQKIWDKARPNEGRIQWMHDEVKLRLPEVLDESFFLHFKLFRITLGAEVQDKDNRITADECGLGVLDLMESAYVPLINTRSTELMSKAQVTTIIPDQEHKVPLGDSFLFGIETRVVSNLHISDAATATVIQNMPMGTSAPNSRALELKDFSVRGTCIISEIVGAADPSQVVRSFYPLMYIHLRNLLLGVKMATDILQQLEVSTNKNGSVNISIKVPQSRNAFEGTIENVKSILALLQKVETYSGNNGNKFDESVRLRRKRMFFKHFFDTFDEQVIRDEPKSGNELRVQTDLNDLVKDTEENGLTYLRDRTDSVTSNDEQNFPSRVGSDIDEPNWEDNHGGSTMDSGAMLSVRRLGWSARRSLGDGDTKSLNRSPSFQRANAPFSRRGYGVSKMDRMRAEAELGEDASIRQLTQSTFFDDDATVMTNATWHDSSSKRGGSLQQGKLAEFNQDDGSHGLMLSNSFQQAIMLDGNSPKDKYREPLKNRISLTLSAFLAPCGAPGVVNKNSSDAIPSVSSELEEEGGRIEDIMRPTHLRKSEIKLCSPGSDEEDESSEIASDVISKLQRLAARKALWVPSNISTFRIRGSVREEDLLNQLSLSVGNGASSKEIYLYEALLLVWLKIWSFESSNFASLAIQLEFFAPICLKSLALRCSASKLRQSSNSNLGKAKVSACFLDGNHMKVLISIVSLWANSLLDELSKAIEDETTVRVGLAGCDGAVDFFTGLLPLVHVAQISEIIKAFINTLQVSDYSRSSSEAPQRTIASFDRIYASRHLRIQVVRRLSNIPCFVALNFPLKYPAYSTPSRCPASTWLYQIQEVPDVMYEGSLSKPYPDGVDRLPSAHWLADLVSDEGFSICASCCEAILAGTIESKKANRLTKKEVKMLQNLAVDSISVLYESMIRRHSIDMRFQGDEARSRVAAIFVVSVFENSLDSVNWLAKMESTHKVRLLWLLCFLHVLQEAPEFLIREQLRCYCDPKNFMLHKFVRLLKLSNSTFQYLITPQTSESSNNMSTFESLTPWIVQECFNIICAVTNVIVDECADVILAAPNEREKLISGVLNLLLHVLSTPLSSVTQLRAMGGASQVIDKFGSNMFLECVGDDLQHWGRTVLTLMNNVALSVRSIAVDFVISLFGSTFAENGTIDELTIVFLTVLPEVAARELAMYSASGKVGSMADAERVLWPLRRALSEVEDANPCDDDRVDPELVPFLANLCRSCQAIIDGVLIEVRLQGETCNIAGASFKNPAAYGQQMPKAEGLPFLFDADEESIYEAANSFMPETAPMQRFRWLITLKSLHEAKGQWVEAAETLLRAARTVADAIPHIKHVWRPSRFKLWRDDRVALWLPSVGSGICAESAGNSAVMACADDALEPREMISFTGATVDESGKLFQPTVPIMCRMLTKLTNNAVDDYLEEEGVDALAFLRLEELLKDVMGVVQAVCSGRSARVLRETAGSHKLFVEESMALRRMSASLNLHLTKVAERMVLLSDDNSSSVQEVARELSFGDTTSEEKSNNQVSSKQYYIRLLLLGKKPERFQESTTIPTFLEWGSPIICRVPKNIVSRAFAETDNTKFKTVDERICKFYSESVIAALSCDPNIKCFFIESAPTEKYLQLNQEKTFVVITIVHMAVSSLVGAAEQSDLTMAAGSKRFFFRTKIDASPKSLTPTSIVSNKIWSIGFVETMVATRFPCPLSRQRSIISSEYITGPVEGNIECLYQC